MDGLRIAHISLPSYNGGGLVRYVQDLANTQIKDDEVEYVCIFYTNSYRLTSRKPSISYKKEFIDIFRINNFNPTTLFEGTLYPELDLQNEELENTIVKKLEALSINIVHFHTFHGLTANLLKKINEKNIKIIYTAHDYQPICNKITLINSKKEVCSLSVNDNCSVCNMNALNHKRLKIRYNFVSNYLKNNKKLKSYIKQIVSKNYKNQEYNIVSDENLTLKIDNNAFEQRRKKFVENLNLFADKIIYSSYITKQLFELVGVDSAKSKLLPVSNLSINKSLKNYTPSINHDNVVFGYLGGDREEKGYKNLIKSFELLYKNNITNWELLIFGTGASNIEIPLKLKENIKILGHHNKNLYEQFEVLIIPSVWPETFNFVAVEGFINKKMIISSNIVGSMEMYKNSGVLLYEYNKEVELYEKIYEVLTNTNKKFFIELESNEINKYIDFKSHYNEILKIYK